MKKVRNQPITGATPEYSKKAPLVPDAKETSANAQTMIQEAPSPFKNRMQTPEMPTGSGTAFKPNAGQAGARAPMNPAGAAIGQSKMPNQAPQIGGRNGWPPPKRKTGNVTMGTKPHRNARFYGE